MSQRLLVPFLFCFFLLFVVRSITCGEKMCVRTRELHKLRRSFSHFLDLRVVQAVVSYINRKKSSSFKEALVVERENVFDIERKVTNKF